MELIFYSFEVLTSTTKLQSMSFIGPLVMKIHNMQFFVGPDSLSNVVALHIIVTIRIYDGRERANHQFYENLDVVYLHHQWSDEAHTLQFCSTGEYFETIEYELHRPLGARDSR